MAKMDPSDGDRPVHPYHVRGPAVFRVGDAQWGCKARSIIRRRPLHLSHASAQFMGHLAAFGPLYQARVSKAHHQDFVDGADLFRQCVSWDEVRDYSRFRWTWFRDLVLFSVFRHLCAQLHIFSKKILSISVILCFTGFPNTPFTLTLCENVTKLMWYTTLCDIFSTIFTLNTNWRRRLALRGRWKPQQLRPGMRLNTRLSTDIENCLL